MCWVWIQMFKNHVVKIQVLNSPLKNLASQNSSRKKPGCKNSGSIFPMLQIQFLQILFVTILFTSILRISGLLRQRSKTWMQSILPVANHHQDLWKGWRFKLIPWDLSPLQQTQTRSCPDGIPKISRGGVLSHVTISYHRNKLCTTLWL